MWAVFIGVWIFAGAYYCRGSYDRLAAAFVSGLEKSADELLLTTRAVRILTDNHRASGVEVENGQRIACNTVISAIDARATFEELLAPDQLPTCFLGRLRTFELSPSAVAIYVATDIDVRAVGAHHETSVYRGMDHERTYAEGLAGRVSAAFVAIPSLTDPSLARPVEHAVVVQAFAARESGETRPDDAHIAEQLLELVEQVLPGLRNHLTFIETAGDPGARHPRVHRMGPIYGWKLSPVQTLLQRVSKQTPCRWAVTGRPLDTARTRHLRRGRIRNSGRTLHAWNANSRARTATRTGTAGSRCGVANRSRNSILSARDPTTGTRAAPEECRARVPGQNHHRRPSTPRS